MKKIIVILGLIFISMTHVYPQNWPKIYSFNAWADWVIETYDKGYIILGTDISGFYGYIIKTDINGTVLWNKKIGDGEHLFFVNNIEQTTDHGFILAGTTTKYGNQQDAYILKLNKCGELDWCSDIYTPSIGDDLGWKVKQTVDKGYILLGLYNDPNPNIRTNLFKFDSIGNLLWHHGYLPDSLAFEDDAEDLLVDSTGFLITASCYYPDPGGGSGGWERFYLIKTDTAGNKLWSTIYGDTSYYYGFPMVSLISKTGNYYSFGKHDVIDSSSDENPAMIKVLGNGEQSYSQDLISNISSGGAGAAVWMNDTAIVNASQWAINMYSVQNVFLKVDTLGNVQKLKYLSPIGGGIVSMAKTFDNKFVSVADNCSSVCQIVAYKVNSDLEYDTVYTHPCTYDSLCPYPITSGVIDPTCDQILDVSEPQSNPGTTQLKVYPNPASNQLTIEFPKYIVTTTGSGKNQSNTVFYQWTTTTLEVYDLAGKQIMIKDIPKDQQQMVLDISSWRRGMYYFRLSYRGQMVSGEKVVVE